ncbi:MAG: hypothetical protein U0232_19755 [Thermomicrobiales bacterium]
MCLRGTPQRFRAAHTNLADECSDPASDALGDTPMEATVQQ